MPFYELSAVASVFPNLITKTHIFWAGLKQQTVPKLETNIPFLEESAGKRDVNPFFLTPSLPI